MKPSSELMSKGEPGELASGRGDVVRAVLLPSLGDEQPSYLDMRLVWHFLLRNWLLLAGAAFVGAVAGYAGSYALQRTYRAEVLVAPVQDDTTGLGSLTGTYGALASAMGIDLSSSANSTAQAIAQLQSRQFIEKFIEDESLMPVLFPAKAGDGDERRRPTLQDAYNRFVRKIMLVREDRVTQLVTIRIDWRDAAVAADWANKLVDRINAVTRADAIQETDLTLEYLRNALEKSDYVSLRTSISSVIEAQFNKRMLAQTRPDYSFRVIDPAKASDADKYAWPRRILLAAFGLVIGGLAGLWGALFIASRASRRATSQVAEARPTLT